MWQWIRQSRKLLARKQECEWMDVLEESEIIWGASIGHFEECGLLHSRRVPTSNFQVNI